MSFPKGNIWQALRSQALDVIPKGSHVDLKNPMTLSKWQIDGSYNVIKSTKKSINIVAFSEEIGGVLLADAQLHLDHAAEHQATLLHDLRSGQWNSPAWLVTTFYYWAYFVAMAFTRLLGDTVVFVNRSIADQLNKIASSIDGKIGSGTFEFICGKNFSISDREIVIKKRGRGLHEQLWRTAFNLLETTYRSIPTASMDSREQRLYLSITNGASVLGKEWPCTLRHLVNYRPGFAYDAVKTKNVLDSLSFLKTSGPEDIDVVVSRLEDTGISVKTIGDIERAPRLAAHMLVDLTILLNLITRHLHEEIVDRHSLDRRSGLRRKNFVNRQGVAIDHLEWPC